LEPFVYKSTALRVVFGEGSLRDQHVGVGHRSGCRSRQPILIGIRARSNVAPSGSSSPLRRPASGRSSIPERPPCGGLAAILLPLAAALEPDKTFVELRNMASNGTIDLLHEFSSICREEFEDIQAQQF
jgi:hypothetical protein